MGLHMVPRFFLLETPAPLPLTPKAVKFHANESHPDDGEQHLLPRPFSLSLPRCAIAPVSGAT
ncbi:hypothetical protein [Burkholderia ubonensis]|uniref:hypothetical protein n=1 Tax=Burkholderia ubonensis TaxID=101571 RepID=UPI0012F8EC03|nr:hypothetical protein [Burkholderia ubonensis]